MIIKPDPKDPVDQPGVLSLREMRRAVDAG